MNLSLDRIVAGPNVRTVPPAAEADAGLLLSIMHSGVLQPILVRPKPSTGFNPPGEEAPIPVNGNGLFEIVLGSRRLRCAREAGLTEIPAEVREMTDAEVRAAQTAENIQRAAMHPVDRWLAIKALVETDGLTVPQAAGVLGLSDREVRQAELLGRLNPTLLELCKVDMPSIRALQVIARAPGKTQIAAAKKHGRITQDHRGEDQVQWHALAQACEVTRISRSLALFDADTSGLAWDEDLFAEPGSAEQFTTTDTEGFLERQRVAVAQAVDALVAAKKRARVVGIDKHGSLELPKGFERKYRSEPLHLESATLPERMERNEWAFFAVGTNGRLQLAFAIDTKAEKEAEKKAAERAKAKTKKSVGEGAEAEPQDDVAPGDEAVPEPGKDAPAELTKEGLKLLHAAKTAALQEALLKQDFEPHDMLIMFVLTLAADNVQVRGPGYRAFDDLVAQLLMPHGDVSDLDEREIRRAAAMAISRVLSIGDHYSSSGHAAEWVGRLVDARGYLGRFDNLPFLEQCKTPALRAAAASGQVKWSGTAAEMRKRLAGNAPDWRPEAAVYGAAAPVAKKEAA